MGKRLIISESEKIEILSLYEQTNTYTKENTFLKKYIGKTINEYSDKQLQTLSGTNKIKSIEYDGNGIVINFYPEEGSYDYGMYSTYGCKYNPSKLDYEGSFNFGERQSWTVYNRTLIDDINQKGTALGIKWCVKPSADFGTKSVNEDTNVTPPPSESILVVKKNPFKYPEYESARRKYSTNLKDGDLFYVENGYDAFISNLEKTFNTEFINNLVGKKARWNDTIIEFVNSNPKLEYPMGENPATPPNVVESKNFGSDRPNIIGHIDIKIDGVVRPYNVSKYFTSNNMGFFLVFIPESFKDYKIDNIKSINDLYTKEYVKKVGPQYVPDDFFEIRKIQREKTDF